MSDPIFRVHNLTKTYRLDGVEVQALRGVDADLAPGELVIMLGRREAENPPSSISSARSIRPRRARFYSAIVISADSPSLS